MTDREKLMYLQMQAKIGWTKGEFADFLLANGVTFATDTNDGCKWIPVTERLPENNKPVLVYCTNITIQGGKIVHIGSLDCKQFWFLRTQPGIASFPVREWQVTHWMPLPEPPQEE